MIFITEFRDGYSRCFTFAQDPCDVLNGCEATFRILTCFMFLTHTTAWTYATIFKHRRFASVDEASAYLARYLNDEGVTFTRKEIADA